MYSIKKIMIVGMTLQVLSVAFYAFAQNWIWIIAAIVFATITMTLVFRTQSIFIANSLNDHNRARGYGLRTTIIQLFSIFAPTIGGILVHLSGGISVEGIRPLYFIQLTGFVAISVYVSFARARAEGMGRGDWSSDSRKVERTTLERCGRRLTEVRLLTLFLERTRMI